MLMVVLSSLFLLTGAAPAPPEAPDPPPAPPKRTLLKGADCLDPSAARSWHYVDGDQLLVDAGRRKYRIHLSGFCTDLGSASELKFRGDSVSGRVCGNAGERLEFRSMSCRIDRVELIDAATYGEASQTGKGHVSTRQPIH